MTSISSTSTSTNSTKHEQNTDFAAQIAQMLIHNQGSDEAGTANYPNFNMEFKDRPEDRLEEFKQEIIAKQEKEIRNARLQEEEMRATQEERIEGIRNKIK